MVIKRKVTKKKVAKRSVANKSTSSATKSVAPNVPKKKGAAPKRKPKAASNLLALGEALVISGVNEWKDKMADAVSSNDEIILDGGEIEQIDGVGLQLLVAVMKDAVNSNTAVSWKAASEVLLDGAAKLGLTEILGLEKLTETE